MNLIDEVIFENNESGKWHNYDVTESVKKIILNPSENYGFLLFCVAVPEILVFESSESNNINKRPKIEITYGNTKIKNQILIKKYSPIKSINIHNKRVLIKIESSNAKTVQILLHSINGKTLFSQTTDSNLAHLDLSSFSNGIYILKVNDGAQIFKKSIFME